MPPRRKKTAAGAAAGGKAAAAAVGKAGFMPPKKPKKGKKKTPIMRYKRYIYKVLKQVRPELGISEKSTMIMNNFVAHNFQNIAKEASILAYYSKKRTITVDELKAAVAMVLPNLLADYANRDGEKAVSNFEGEASAKKSQGRKRGRGQQA
uniref:MgH2B n=1 Tax=Lilium davidii var. unicolor TaxID=1473204 RepID=A0A0U5KM31_LILDA|nr:mgH2B [Lilium davidii var. unicolor]